jgi:hypothetical protein
MKGYTHPKVGGPVTGLKQSKRSTLPGAFKAPKNPYREARTEVTKATGGKTPPAGKF